MSAVVDVWGWRARFALARGQTIADVTARLPAIESALGTHRGAVRVYPTTDDLANRFELRVLSSDPHADAVTWPGPSVASVAQPIDLGPFEDAAPARVLFLRRHAVVGGVSGSGKSGGLNVIVANLTACPDVAITTHRGADTEPAALREHHDQFIGARLPGSICTARGAGSWIRLAPMSGRSARGALS